MTGVNRVSLLGALPAELRLRVEALPKPTPSTVVDELLLDLLRVESLATRHLSVLLNRSKPVILQAVNRLMAAGLIEQTRPEEPYHPFQAYVPTARAFNSAQPSLWDTQVARAE
jgi:hypothetical protein